MTGGGVPRRIHITGGQGTGKTTLAARIGAMTGWPVHELDRVARLGRGNGPERPASERDAMVAAIAATDRWITDGVQQAWVDPLLERAEVIVWLDHVTVSQASRRMVWRFLSGAFEQLRTRRGRERFLRFGDYARHGRDLVVALRQRGDAPRPDAQAAALEPYRQRLVRCRSEADIERFLSTLERGTRSGSVIATDRAA